MKNEIMITVVFGLAFTMLLVAGISGCGVPECLELSTRCVGTCLKLSDGRCDFDNTKQACEGGDEDNPCKCSQRQISSDPSVTVKFSCICPRI